MNFLAHIFLSGDIGPRMIGNFIGDYVKGKRYEDYQPDIQYGILLHRKIDEYTDNHLIVKQSSSRFRSCYHRYASVITDVVYDHYLASLWDDYCDLSLQQYVNAVHSCLIKNYFLLPVQVKYFLPFLIKSRRLENYKYVWGIEKALNIMSRHSTLPDRTPDAIAILENEYEDLKTEFQGYFKDLQQMVHSLNHSGLSK